MSAVGPIGYLVSRYPAPSHTFILREVAALRERGVQVETISVRRAAGADLLSERDRREAAHTWAILPAPAAAVAGVAATVLRHPISWLAVGIAAQRSAPPGLRPRLWRWFYLVEATMVLRHLRCGSVRHLHAHFANVAADVAQLTVELGRRLDGDGRWTWSFTMHGPTEFYDVERFGLAEKAASADFVVCISDFARSQLMRLSPPQRWRQFHVVHCGIELEAFPPVDREHRGGPPVVLFVGRLVADKALPVLLEALSDLRRSGHELRLVVVGDGAEAARFRRLADRLGLSELVRWDGALGHHEVVRRYGEADVFCLPSFAEGLPVVLMEAMATGLPVVTTAIAGVPELVRDGENGRVVAPGRVDALAEALAELLDAPELRRALGDEARRSIETGFDVRASAEQLERLLSTVGGAGVDAAEAGVELRPPTPAGPAPRVSVIVPAHDEADVIERCLTQLEPDAAPDLLEVIVVCNGCYDDTADRARAASKRVRVAETPVPSKWRALRIGDELARSPVRVYLDADTSLSPGAIRALAERLENAGPLVVAPELRLDTAGMSWPMRRFLDVWRQGPYLSDRPVGGIYALSAAGRARFAEFPPIIADDLFVRSVLADHERDTVSGEWFAPLLPRRLRDMARVHARHHAGNEELRRWATEHGVNLPGLSVRSAAWLRPLVIRPGNWPGLAFFLAVKVAARVRSGRGTWHRDDVARRAS